MSKLNMDLSKRLAVLKYNGEEYIYVDQSHLLPKQMIELSKMHQELAFKTGLPFISNFEGTFVTGPYLEHVDKFLEATKHLSRKGATIGMNENKKWILKGRNEKHSLDIMVFSSREDALKEIFKKS